MQMITQHEVLGLIASINAFADRAEQLISTMQANYNENKHKLQNKHEAALANIDSSYQCTRTEISQKAAQTIKDAHTILAEINQLDEKLSSVDKYYDRTKRRKFEELANTTSGVYARASDYFHAMDSIKADFSRLYRKYSEDILPGLLNGLNYLFSSRRKQDYDDLIIMKNTVTAFVAEIEEVLPDLTNENLNDLKQEYTAYRRSVEEQQCHELAYFEDQYTAMLDEVAGRIVEDLDAVLPDDLVENFSHVTETYGAEITKVNSGAGTKHDMLNVVFLEYSVDYFVQSPIIASTIQQKCLPIWADGAIRVPVAATVKDTPVWVITNDNSNATAVQSFIHAIMFGFLSSCPVARLSYRIVDPENRGNSIAPFFDAKKKLPELFGEKISISREDIALEIGRLNQKIEDILQNKLGNQYDNIFDYANSNPSFTSNIELLLLYDFPKGFDERTLADLRNIIRNGSRCGIYTVISYIPESEASVSREYQQSLNSILELSVELRQNELEFTYGGLPLAYYPMPDKNEFAKFFSKYMLIFEGIKNRGIAFSPLIRKLVEAKDSRELDANIAEIRDLMASYEKAYAKVPELRAVFPSHVPLGNVVYPSDIFSDSPGYRRIVEAFGAAHGRGLDSANVELPLSFDLRNTSNLFLYCQESSAERVLKFTHHVIWSFLSYIPVNKVNVCVFDSEQRGNSIIPFLDFRKKSPDTFDQKIYTNAEAIYGRLKDLNRQIDDFIQEKLGNRYKDILDYNINTPSRAEPITLLVIYDFPAGMDGRTIDLLMNILKNGNKCGIYVMICYNPDISFSRYESIDERLEVIAKYCASIDFKDGHFVLLPYNLHIRIPEEITSAAMDAFIHDYLERSETIKKQGLSFRDIIANDLFSMDSSKSLKIPVGVGDGDSIVSVTIGEGSSHHGLIAGATGSGKSTLLHTLIMSSMLTYSPEQLHLYLMDFKSGTEFKVYESVRLPHIQLLALDAMQEFGESILENLVAEMEHRGSLFKSVGQTSLKGYVQAMGQPLPRILVIMDEFQILFNDSANRKVALNCAELTKRIVTEGRAFGIHLFMATQSTKVISDLTLSHGTIEQMRIRIGLKCAESDAHYLFAENDAKALTMMKGPIGTAVMNLDYTEQSNIGFRAAYCDDQTQREFLNLISSTFADRPYSLQTFEGGRTTALLDYFQSAGISKTDSRPVRIHMGTLIKVAPPFVIEVDKKRKHNLLVCGANEKMANTVVNNYIISAALHSNVSIYCMDGDTLVGETGSSSFYDAMKEVTPCFHIAQNRGDMIRWIKDIYQDYQEWKKQGSDQTVFVIIKNLQFLDIIRSMLKGEPVDESEYLDDDLEEPGVDPANPFAAVTSLFENKSRNDGITAGDKLLRLIADGSGFGIHFIVSCLEFQTVRECMIYAENALTKFPERIIFSLGENDADHLIENVSVAGLRENTAYFTDGVKNTFQMKPYTSPDISELKRVFE